MRENHFVEPIANSIGSSFDADWGPCKFEAPDPLRASSLRIFFNI